MLRWAGRPPSLCAMSSGSRQGMQALNTGSEEGRKKRRRAGGLVRTMKRLVCRVYARGMGVRRMRSHVPRASCHEPGDSGGHTKRASN